MKGGKYLRRNSPRNTSPRLSAKAFLEANFLVATREQRIGWFGTADPEQFKRTIGSLYSKSRHDAAARQQLNEMIEKVRAHVLKLTRRNDR